MSSVLVIGTYRQTLTIIRSLARAGQNVILGVHGEAATCNYSRYVSEIWHHPDYKLSNNDFVAALMKFATERNDIKCIFPVGELEIRLLAAEFDEISSKVKVLMCDPAIVATCLDKPTMSSLVDQLEIPQSSHATASDRETLIRTADTIGYPCIVKLADSEFLLHGKKAVIYHDPDSIRRDFKEWPIENKSLVVQTYVAGERFNLYFFACEGRVVSLGQVLALRTDRLDGTGLSVSGCTVSPDPVLVEFCKVIVEHLNYTGAGCMQFLVDEDNGVTSFLEHNPRLGAGCMLPYKAGLDLPRLMLDFALNEQIDPNEPLYPCKVGVQYAWTTGDLMGLKKAVLDREVSVRGAAVWIFAMFKTILTSPHHMSWDWQDPLPTVVQIGRLCSSVFRARLPGKPG